MGQCAYLCDVNLGQVVDHEVGGAQSRQVAFASDCYAGHCRSMSGLDASYCVFDDYARAGWDA